MKERQTSPIGADSMWHMPLETQGWDVLFSHYTASQDKIWQPALADKKQPFIEIHINREGLGILQRPPQSFICSPHKAIFSNYLPHITRQHKSRRMRGHHSYCTLVFTQRLLTSLLEPEQVELLFQAPLLRELPVSNTLGYWLEASLASGISRLHLTTHAFMSLNEALKLVLPDWQVATNPDWKNRTKWVKQYLKSHLADPLNLKQLATDTSCTPQHLCRAFKQKEGLTLSAYLQQVRLQHASSLLALDDLNMTEIALECGFSSPSHFSQRFQHTYACSPRTYRKRLQARAE